MASPAIVHQKQRLQLCLLHALNNLFQGETTFSRSELDSIASGLAGASKSGFTGSFARLFSSHYNIVTGNYDANVLLIALQTRNAEAIWYDRRKGAAGMNLTYPDENLIGIILNHPTERFSGMWKGRHWSALKMIVGVWYDLDSYLPEPVAIGDSDAAIKDFLERCFATGCEAFLVYRAGGVKSDSSGF